VMTITDRPPVEVRGWVLYDDACGFCRRWVPFWSGTLAKRGFAIAPLQSKWVQAKLGAQPEDLLEDLRLLLTDGSQVRGADVYRYVMQRIWWAYPLYVLSVAPILWRVFDWAYRTFATHRYRFSRACRLPGATRDR
jgi:predicted DCC family thiol-disulfide oxidoreductase YuxK